MLPFLDAADVAEAGALAEEHGWDGIFLAESVWGVDAWIALAAAAMRTGRVRLGTMLTPLPRFKPWDLASRVGTVDRLSGGRAQLAVGLGALHPGWTAFEADTGRAERARLLDEGLAVYDGLMRGQPFEYSGSRYVVTATDFFPPEPTVQRPRVPVWVVGAYPAGRSLRRAARWDGLVPNVRDDGGGMRGPSGPAELERVVAAVRRERVAQGLAWDGYDVISEGVTAPGESVRAWADAGATWWIESNWSADGIPALHERIVAGPPS